jgi:hypothetical protein
MVAQVDGVDLDAAATLARVARRSGRRALLCRLVHT